MFHFAPHSTLNTSTSSLSPTSLVLQSSSSPNPDLLSTYPNIHCEDPRHDGTSTEYSSSTVHEPKRIELNRILVKPQNQIIDDQEDVEEIGLKKVVLQPISLRFGSKHCDASRLEPRRRAIAWDAGFTTLFTGTTWNEGQAGAYHSERERLMVHSSRNPEVSGKLDAEWRSKCTTNTSLSLKTRKLDDKFFSRSRSFKKNLMQCFRATVNRVRTRFQKETAVTNW